MVKINLEAEKKKYATELNAFIAELGQIEKQRAELLQAIAERQGILAFLNSLNEQKEIDEKITP